MPSTPITITGNLTAEPSLTFTNSGAPVANMTVAVNERYRDNNGKWQDGVTSFFSVNAWQQLAENAAESLNKGDRVIVTGTIRQRSYETTPKNPDDSGKRTVWEIRASGIGADLSYANVRISKVSRGAPPPEDPWASNTAPGNAEDGNHGYTDEPPF